MVWTNKYGDYITRQSGYMDKSGQKKVFTININGNYIKSVGGLNLAKNFINKHRNEKLSWAESNQ